MRKILRFAKIVSLTVAFAGLLGGSAFAVVHATRPQAPVAKVEDFGTLACGTGQCLVSKNIDRVVCDREQCSFFLTGNLGKIECSTKGCTASREVLAQFSNNRIPKECPEGRCSMLFDPLP